MDFILKSIVEIRPSNIQSLQKTKILMKKYANLPMEYANATLVCLAADTSMQNLATFDKKDYSIYTPPARNKFNLVLSS